MFGFALEMGWLRRKRDERLLKQVGRSLSRLPPLEMTPQLRLFGSYMNVRNLLAAGDDPTKVAAIGQELPVDALGYFRAGLRIMFDTDDELAAFERFARELHEDALRLRHGQEALARLEMELQMVRDYLAQQQSGGLPSPPA